MDPKTDTGAPEDDMPGTLPATAGHGAWALVIGLMAMSARTGDVVLAVAIRVSLRLFAALE